MQVAALRAERHALELDPRFTAVLSMIRKGTFGWTEFFAPVLAAIEGPDFYLVATDFPEYLDIQARSRATSHASCVCGAAVQSALHASAPTRVG